MREKETYGVTVESGTKGMSIIYDIWDSDFDGNDFAYTFYLDTNNAKIFVGKLGRNAEDDLQKAIEERFGKEYYSCGLEEYFKKEGIHGTLECFEDYPGGINKSREF